jgi:hypothetical protein
MIALQPYNWLKSSLVIIMEDQRMPLESLTFLQRLQEYGILGYAWILLLSVWAGTVRYLTNLEGKRPTLFGWVTETIISGFVGIIAAMTCQYYGIDYLMTAALTGVAAHNGTRGLYVISQILKKNSKISIQLEPTHAKLNSKREDQDGAGN